MSAKNTMNAEAELDLDNLPRMELARLAALASVVSYGKAVEMGRKQLRALLDEEPREALIAHLKSKEKPEDERAVGVNAAAKMFEMVSASMMSPEQVGMLIQSEVQDLEERALAAVRRAVLGFEASIKRIEVIDASGAARKVEGHTHQAFEKTLKLASIRQNVLLVGPAGSGKTALAAQVAQALGLPFSFVSCSGGMSENQLTGWLLPIEAGGAFGYVSARFVDAFEKGGVFLLDEIDAADENVLLAVNAALANGKLTIPQRHANPVALRHKDFVCIAAANTFGHGGDLTYSGRNRLDGATLDRFRAGIIKMDYDPELEKLLIDAEVLKWALPIREQIKSLKLKRVMSTRALLDFTRQKQMLGFGAAEWEESFFADWTRDEMVKIGRDA